MVFLKKCKAKVLNLLLDSLLLGKPAVNDRLRIIINPLYIRDNGYVRPKLNNIQGATL
jgi:hypothetical protein